MDIRLRIARPWRAPARGSVLLFAMAIILLLAVAGVALVRYAGGDRVDAAKLGTKDRGLACAEAGLQYARRFFGSRYPDSNNWNDYLNPALGYRYDEAAGDTYPPDLDALPKQTRGKSDGTNFDKGADLDGDGRPDFWVSVHDDDDERPLGATHNPAQDNNEIIVIRSECTNPAWAIVEGNATRNVVLEATLAHVQGTSGYGIASGGSNAPDLVGR